MTARSIKKFYQNVSLAPRDGGFVVMLDAHPLRTPSRADLILRPRALAEAVAEEWRSQGEAVYPDAMLLTRIVNTAVDRIAPQREIIADQILDFARSDLVCYRADAPAELASAQASGWNPWLAWLERRHNARLRTAVGIGFVEQTPEALAALKSAIAAHEDFELTALASAAGIMRSVVLALALSAGEIDSEKAFALSRIDEDFQAKHWGSDAEAELTAKALADELRASGRFFDLLRSPKT